MAGAERLRGIGTHRTGILLKKLGRAPHVKVTFSTGHEQLAKPFNENFHAVPWPFKGLVPQVFLREGIDSIDIFATKHNTEPRFSKKRLDLFTRIDASNRCMMRRYTLDDRGRPAEDIGQIRIQGSRGFSLESALNYLFRQGVRNLELVISSYVNPHANSGISVNGSNGKFWFSADLYIPKAR